MAESSTTLSGSDFEYLEDEDVASSSSSTSTIARNLLDVLKAPKESELSRKRKVSTNPPPSGKKRRTAVSNNLADPKSVSPQQRVNEFLNEDLTVSAKKLFCNACHEEISLKKSVVQHHIASEKHKAGKQRLANKEARERDIVEALKSYDQTCHPKGETLPDACRVYRVKVLTSFLRAGVAISKVDSFREILEENAYSITGRQHMSEMIPFILSEETDRIKIEINSKKLSVIFDGTTHVNEAIAVVLRFVDDDYQIHQRLVHLQLLAKSVTGQELARVLISVLSTKLSIDSTNLVAATRDRASVNNVAMETLSVLYPNLLDVGCFSHTLDRAGTNFQTPTMEGFVSKWASLFSRSPKASLAWKTQTGLPIPSYSETRWWSKWEVAKQVLIYFGDVVTFVNSSPADLAPATIGKLREVLHDPSKSIQLKMELAISVDAGEAFVKSTYVLEGDGPLVLRAYDEVTKVSAAIATAHYPNTEAIARQISASNATLFQQLISYATSCVTPVYDYFESKFGNNGQLHQLVKCFKAARMFSPVRMSELQASTTLIDDLTAFPFLLTDSELSGKLKDELPTYIAIVKDISHDVDELAWWKRHESQLPHLASVCKTILLVQPSSAAAERVFSLLQNSFCERQQNSLQDYIEASLMLQYNKR